MQKNKPEIPKFEQDFRISKNFKIEISHHLDKRKIDITRLILKIEDSNFTCKPIFLVEKIIFWHQDQKTTFLV